MDLEGTADKERTDKDPTTETNRAAWESDAFGAWVERFGAPEEVAASLTTDPTRLLGPLRSILGSVTGKKIVNVMGSNGIKAVALALLGNTVTVVDFSYSNARYALAVARSAGVEIEYRVIDIAKVGSAVTQTFDLAVAEMGIVHYFTDLTVLTTAVRRLLVPGGTFVLRDFHPVSTKLLSYRGSTAKVRKYKVSGDYFDSTVETQPVPFGKHRDGSAAETGAMVHLRKWTLGEIVTATAKAGLRIEELLEEPNQSSSVFDKGIPKTFTLVASADRGSTLRTALQ